MSRAGWKLYAITYVQGPAPVVVTDFGDDKKWVNYELEAGQSLVVFCCGHSWTRINEPNDLEIILKNHVGHGGTAHAEATILLAGFMSALDKQTLDRLAMTSAYSHPTGDGNLHVPATGTSSLGMILRAGSTAGDIFWGMLSPSEIGAAAAIHANDHAVGGRDLLTPAMIGAALADHTHNLDDIAGITVLDGFEQVAHKGAPNGYAPLNASRIVPSVFLPSFVDDIIEVADVSALPGVGEAGKVYVDLSTNRQYRWGGTVYVPLSASPGTSDDLVEGSKNLFFTPERSQQAQIQADWNAHGSKAEILNKPTLGTASSKDVATTGNALAGQVVLWNDTRLSDPRTPIAHTHPQSEVTGLVDALAPLASVPALARSSASALAALTGFSPSLFVDMLEASALTSGVPTGFTFTRASAGTCFGPDGLLRTAGAGELRHEWCPATGAYLGALIEEGRTNLLRRSNGFGQAPWAGVGAGAVLEGFAAGPDGLTSAALLSDADSGGGLYHLDQDFLVPNDSSPYAASIFVKKNASRYFSWSLWLVGGAPGVTVFGSFDFDTGAVTGPCVAKDAGNGWWRLSLTAANNGSGNAYGSLKLWPGKTDDATGSVLVWGAQVEAGPAASSYIPTVDAAATRAADLLTRSTAGWLRQGVGTVLCEARLGAGEYPYAWGLLTDQNERIICYRDSVFATPDTPHNLLITVGGATQASMPLAASSGRFTAAYGPNDVIVSSDASPDLQADDAAAVPIVTTLGLGSSGVMFFANGHVRRFAYFPARLP